MGCRGIVAGSIPGASVVDIGTAEHETQRRPCQGAAARQEPLYVRDDQS